MKNKKWRKIIGAYFLTLFISLLLFFPIDYIIYKRIDIETYFIVNILILSVVIFLYTLAINFFNRKFMNINIFFRIFIEILYAIIIMMIMVFMVHCILWSYNIYIFFSKYIQDKSIFISSIEAIFIILLLETIFTYYKRKENEIEREKFKYNQLKHQLNPHFLFNSLNILSAMIYTKASNNESLDFIEKLSDFYHYVLKNEGKNLISLKEEIEFINKYGEILKIRFADGFVLKINLNEKDYNRRVLFMSLQLLVENAVKHNIASKEEPLIVSIYSENDFIICSNNKIIRHDNIVSTGLGLENLNERYKIISRKEIKIIEDEEKFIVKIPMI